MTAATQNPKSEIKNRLIVALDVPTANEARAVFDELRETGCAFKIGMQLFTMAGSLFVEELIKDGAKIFLDLKFHDIPNTVASAGIAAARLGVWMFNVHAAGGREMMERTIGVVRETTARENLNQPQIIAVTVLTSSTAKTLREIGIESETLPQVLRLAELTRDCDLDGVVASPLEAAAIRARTDADFLIVTPGIRWQPQSANDDQQRIMTPRRAVQAGSDYLVVGRPILEAQNKLAAARGILSEIEASNAQ